MSFLITGFRLFVQQVHVATSWGKQSWPMAALHKGVCQNVIIMYVYWALTTQQKVNSLGPSDAIWRQRSGSPLAQVMACCLTAPSHYLNQCWLIINEVEWHSSMGNFTRDTTAIKHWNYLKIKCLKCHSNLPGANELRSSAVVLQFSSWCNVIHCLVQMFIPATRFAHIGHCLGWQHMNTDVTDWIMAVLQLSRLNYI